MVVIATALIFILRLRFKPVIIHGHTSKNKEKNMKIQE